MQICTINFDTVWKNPKANLEKKEILIKQALEINKAVDTIVFPELSFTWFICDESNKELAENIDGLCVTEIQRIAKENAINIIAGFIEKSDNEKPLNSGFVVNKKWELISTYSKNHLFTSVWEQNIYSPWEHLSIFELDWWKCWLFICFDVRFPRLFEAYKEQWVECLFWLYNWLEWRNKKELFQAFSIARAHENQCFVISIDREWKDPNTWYTWSSAMVNPYWESIENKEISQGALHFWTLDKNDIQTITQSMPLQESFKEKYNIK